MRAHALNALLLIAVAAAMPGVVRADEGFSLVINGRTGGAFLRNDSGGPVELDGYLARSPLASVFDPVSWNSLQDNPSHSGWLEGAAAGNRLSEANLFGSSTIDPGQSIGIGSPYEPFVPTAIGQPEPGFGTMEFTYSVAGSGVFTGDIEFIQRNTVVLVVNPTTGEASLENQSIFDIELDSYLIRSVPEVLNTDGWMPLAESLGSGGGWASSTGVANRIAEGNLFGSTFLAAGGGSLPLGQPIDPDRLNDETDLVLDFTIVGTGTLAGGVLFTAAAAPDLPGDFNNDNIVDAADYTVWRDRLGLGFTPGQFNTWKNNFGATGGGGAAAGAALASVAVPEPASCVIACVFASITWIRRRHRRSATR